MNVFRRSLERLFSEWSETAVAFIGFGGRTLAVLMLLAVFTFLSGHGSFSEAMDTGKRLADATIGDLMSNLIMVGLILGIILKG